MAANLQHALRLFVADARRVCGLFDRRFAAHLLKQLLRDVPQLAHRLDHVNRNADRSRLIGNRTGNCLANPPRGIGAELEAAAILVFIDGPHQPGVAFLDEIEEAQAAVAVLLRDAHHEAQVAAREFAFGVFVLGKPLLHDLNATTKPGRLLERNQHQVLEFFLQVCPFFFCRTVAAQRLDGTFEIVHSLADLFQLLHQRLDFLRANRKLFDQRDGLTTARLQLEANLLFVFFERAFVGQPVEVVDVVFHQRFERPQVVRHSLKDLVFLEVLGLRDLDGAVERQVAGLHALERLEDVAKGVIAFEDFATEAPARDFDLLRERNFEAAIEERDLAHLGEVHPDGVVDVTAIALVIGEGRFFATGGDDGHFFGRASGLFVAVLGVDDVDTVLFQLLENIFEPTGIGRPFGECLVHLVEGERPRLLAALDEHFQHVFGFVVHS